MAENDVPEVGKTYHVFDDGKISLSRHFLVKCKEVIPFKEFSSDPKYKEVYEAWKYEVNHCDWLYSTTTDYVVICEAFDESTNAVDPNEELLYYARTTYWAWFGFGTMLDDGFLDVDGHIWRQFYSDTHDPENGYSAEYIAEVEALDKFK